jgi:hypothetical protein
VPEGEGPAEMTERQLPVDNRQLPVSGRQFFDPQGGALPAKGPEDWHFVASSNNRLMRVPSFSK